MKLTNHLINQFLNYISIKRSVTVLSLTKAKLNFYDLTLNKYGKEEHLILTIDDLVDLADHPKAYPEIRKYLFEWFKDNV
jgi:hypothetical protein